MYPLQYNVKDEAYRKVIVFDTETTGLLQMKKGTLHELDVVDVQPYITQISWIVYDLRNDCVENMANHYVKLPENVEISKEAQEVTGITADLLNEKGVCVVDALCNFIYAYLECDMAVCHNWFFDKSLIMFAIIRNIDLLKEKCGLHIDTVMAIFHPTFQLKHGIYSYCTMLEGTHLCDIRKTKKNGEKYKNAKYPKLIELYGALFDEEPENMHNAMFDVIACLRCFLKMRIGKEIPRPRLYRLLASVC